MSRSYKKFPVAKDNGKYSKECKQIANRKFRRNLHLDEKASGNIYKKYTETWDIHDFVSYWPWGNAKATYEHPAEGKRFRKEYPTLEDFRTFWKKEMLRK